MVKAVKVKKSEATKKTTVCGTGRRKTAVAQVTIVPGKGEIVINNKSLENYFPRPTAQKLVYQPLEVTESVGKFAITAKVHGGGASGQAGAVRLGIARALVRLDESHAKEVTVTAEEIELTTDAAAKQPVTTRKKLRKANLLTRDSRAVERKKVGHHKARKGTQFSKR